MKAIRNIWPAYLTGLVIALAMLVGFILGVITTVNLAQATAEKAQRQTIAAFREGQ